MRRRSQASRAIYTTMRIVVVCAGLGSLTAPHVAAQEAATAELGRLSRSFEAMIARVSPSVVKILVSGFVSRGGIVSSTEGLVTRQRSTGSGVIVDSSGYIVTNAHVVAGARRVQVLLPPSAERRSERQSILKGGGELVGAQVVGLDEETDLAILKVQQQGLPMLRLADSDSIRKGQLVFAFGSPLGLENSVSMGVVSSVARQLREEDPMVYIQTDATINPGNSGGPLVNSDGDIVGVNTLILSQSGGSEGIGFAAPSNIVRNVYEQLRATGAVHRGAIGVHAQTITPVLATALELPRTWGVVVGDVFPDGPAEKAGLRIGDVIVSLDGKSMENGRQFDVNLYRRRIGESVDLEVVREGKTRRISVKVVQRPSPSAQFMPMVDPQRNLVPQLGILALDITANIRSMLPTLRRPEGVVVAGRAVDAPFWSDGLLPGDVIHRVNGTPVGSIDELRKALAPLKVYAAVALQIERQGRMQFVAFELE